MCMVKQNTAFTWSSYDNLPVLEPPNKWGVFCCFFTAHYKHTFPNMKRKKKKLTFLEFVKKKKKKKKN